MAQPQAVNPISFADDQLPTIATLFGPHPHHLRQQSIFDFTQNFPIPRIPPMWQPPQPPGQGNLLQVEAGEHSVGVSILEH